MLLSLAWCGVVEADFRRDYVQGRKALSKNDWENAAAKFRSAIEGKGVANETERLTSTGFAPYLPYFQLGQALHGMGDCTGAVEAWEASLQQGVVQKLSNEYAQLQAGMQSCGPQTIDVSRIASQASSSINSLDEAKEAYAVLSQDPGLSAEWTANWKPALDQVEQEISSLQSRLQTAEAAQDAEAIETITAEADLFRETLLAEHSRASDRASALEAERIQLATAAEREKQLALDAQSKQEQDAEEARLAEQRRQQNAADEAKRLAAIREREEAQRQAREQRELLQRRESIASAQRELRTELNNTTELLRQTNGDASVKNVRTQLGQLVQAGQAMVASEAVPDLEKQAQAVRDGIRKYQQVSQEWESGQREIARRTPPPELKQMAEAYFAGNYEAATSLADPKKFTEDRLIIQAYLFRSAAMFNLYWLSGGNDETILQKAKSDITEIKRLNRDFTPYVGAFSPKYLEFYQGA